MKKKFLALLLAFVMVAGMLPLTALAEETTPDVIRSPLGDTNDTNPYTSAQLNLDGYTVTTVQDSSYTSDNTVTVYEVTVKHPALLQHYNAASPKAAGLWVGIGVPITIKGADSGQGEDASSYFPFITNKSNFSEVVTMFKETGYAGSDNGYKGYSAWGYRSNDGTHVFQWYNVAGDKYKPNSGYTPYLVERNPQTTESKTTTYTYNVYRIKFDVTEGHLVKFETPANGTLKVTADGKDVTTNMPYAVGTVLTITATPAEGYKVGSVKINGSAIDAADGTYTTTVTDADVTISAEFAALPPEPTFTAAASGNLWGGKTVADLQSGTITVEKDATTGKYAIGGLTLKNITDWTAFNEALKAEQSGYYVVIAVPKTIGTNENAKTVKGMILPGYDAEGNPVEKKYETDDAINNAFTDNSNSACYVVMHLGDAATAKTKPFTIKLKYGEDTPYTDYTFICSDVNLEGAFTVTFNLNGADGTAPDAQTVASGAKITAPTAPTRDGYTFGGWYKEAECTTAWNFDTDTVEANTTLYAKWTENTTPVTPPSGGGGGTSTTPPVTSDKDSGTTSTTVKPSVKDESASVTVSNSTANALVNKTVQDKTDSAVIEVKPAAGQNVNEVKAEIPAKAVANLASKTDASLTVATPVANVTISNDALADVSKDAKTVAVTAAAKTDESTGETTYEVAVLKDGKPVDELGGELKVALPVDEQSASAGMGLVAVLVDENGNETIITKSVLTEDGKLVMALNSGSATVKYVDNSRSYADEIPSWAADAVQFTSSRQLFMGVSENDFGANTTMNRAMLVTVLHRLEGEPTPTKPAGFQDVSDDSWYAASAAWSAEMGIVAGTENGFDGNRPITRQDLALMLYRYANVYGSGKGSSADFSHMGGADDVADYAAEAMRWAVGSGIIVGDENNNLDPQSPTTRAQVSVMLMRFVELLAAK